MNLRTIANVAVLFASVVAGAAAFAQPAEPPANQPSVDFARLDANKDGFVSRAEAQADKEVIRWFSSADTNHDGKLTEDEYIKGRAADDRKKAEQFAGDTEITTKIKTQLLAVKGFPSTAVSVSTSYGVVNLSGTVDTAEQVSQAGAIAAKVKGVKSVQNSIRVK